MSGFTPRSWKSQAEPEAERHAEAVGKFHAYRHGKPNNLPNARTPLIGREQEIAEITTLLQASGFVTLVGAGGVGKTRCALHAATAMGDKFTDGVWFVDFAPIADSDLVASTIAQALDLPLSPSQAPIDTLIGYLKRKQLLLVLDNCEHVIEIARTVVSAILDACPQVHLLTTSREGLHVAGEQQYRMPSLAIPPADATLSAQEVLSFGAARLFVDRAFAVDRRFAISDENALFVSEICRHLDGIPLAIELAAARINVLSPQQLAQKLDERFRVLTGGDRSALARHQTMQALIDWSYELLDDEDKRAFRRLSLFAGSFTLDLAYAFYAAEGLGDYEVLDIITSLVDKSLVQAEQIENVARYRFLESTREFAREKLVKGGEYAAASRALTLTLTESAERIEVEWTYDRGAENVLRSRRDLENWRAALRWALREGGDVALGQRLAAALRFAWARFAPAEGRGWIGEALAQSTPAEDVLGKLYLADAHLAMLQTQYKQGLLAARRALALHETASRPRLHAEAQLMAGAAAGLLGLAEESEPLLQAALSAFRLLNAYTDAGSALQYLGVLRMNAGDIAASRSLYQQALESYQTGGADALASHMALQIAEVEFQEGNGAKALLLAQDALASDRARGDENSAFYGLCNVAAYELALGQAAEASVHAREALSLSSLTGNDAGLPFALQRLAAVAAVYSAARERPSELNRLSASILGFVDCTFEEFGFTRDYTERQEYERALTALDDAIGAQSRASLMFEGRGWTRERVIKAAETIAGDLSHE